MKKFLIRLDDACPYMDKKRWELIEQILDKYNIKPLIGIIPSNADHKQQIDVEDPQFWDKARNWERKGYSIALHGYDHCYVTDKGGLNPVHNRSEFAGVSLEIQKKKVKEGYVILKNHGLYPKVFYAPSHTFDVNTINALITETPIRIISDTIAFKPYQSYGITFIPQQVGQFRDIPFSGYFTFCFHPNNMEEKDFEQFERFIKNNRDSFIDYSEMLKINPPRRRNFMECILQNAYYMLHKLKK